MQEIGLLLAVIMAIAILYYLNEMTKPRGNE